MHFQHITTENNLKEMISSAFNLNLAVDGSWGYTHKEATVILKLPTQTSQIQFEHNLALMRAYLEMNMTLSKEMCYGSITIGEIKRERIIIEKKTYDKVTYTIKAIKELTYAKFIKEYKEKYGSDSFNLNEHFLQRKEATIERIVTHWFEVESIYTK